MKRELLLLAAGFGLTAGDAAAWSGDAAFEARPGKTRADRATAGPTLTYDEARAHFSGARAKQSLAALAGAEVWIQTGEARPLKPGACPEQDDAGIIGGHGYVPPAYLIRFAVNGRAATSEEPFDARIWSRASYLDVVSPCRYEEGGTAIGLAFETELGRMSLRCRAAGRERLLCAVYNDALARFESGAVRSVYPSQPARYWLLRKGALSEARASITRREEAGEGREAFTTLSHGDLLTAGSEPATLRHRYQTQSSSPAASWSCAALSCATLGAFPGTPRMP